MAKKTFSKKVKLRGKEIFGLIMRALGAASFALGIYYIVWLAMRPIYYRSIQMSASGGELLIILLFFMIGAVLWSLGGVEFGEYVKKTR